MRKWLLPAVLLLLAPRGLRAEDRDLNGALDQIEACRENFNGGGPKDGPCAKRPPERRERPAYKTMDQAAIAFVDFARTRREQRNEYCSYIVRTSAGFQYTPLVTGDMDHCPTTAFPPGTVASVHTHPLWGPANDLSHSSQIFSTSDYRYAVRPELRAPLYLGAPAGHVLRYDPGASECRGSMIKYGYTMVRPPSAGANGELAYKPDVFVYLEGAKNEPFCKNGSAPGN